MEEKILNLPQLRRSGDGYIGVDPDFRAIFTSNPEEYAGVHKTQDALMDRLITIKLGHFDRESEINVAMSKSGLERKDVEVIVDIVRELRGVGVNNNRPTIRACIAIAKILAHVGGRARMSNPSFMGICRDALSIDTVKVTREGQSIVSEQLEDIIKRVSKNPRGRK